MLQGETERILIMVCYVNGVTPAVGNEQTDSVQVGKNDLERLNQTKNRMEQTRLEQAAAKQRARFKDLADSWRKLYADASKELKEAEKKQLEEMEKKLEEEKALLEAELEGQKIKTTPEYYRSMDFATLEYEYIKALKAKSPNLDAIRQELHRRVNTFNVAM